jgi:hypothetical protein
MSGAISSRWRRVPSSRSSMHRRPGPTAWPAGCLRRMVGAQRGEQLLAVVALVGEQPDLAALLRRQAGAVGMQGGDLVGAQRSHPRRSGRAGGTGRSAARRRRDRAAPGQRRRRRFGQMPPGVVLDMAVRASSTRCAARPCRSSGRPGWCSASRTRNSAGRAAKWACSSASVSGAAGQATQQVVVSRRSSSTRTAR